MHEPTTRIELHRLAAGAGARRDMDAVAVEEPLEIRRNGTALAVVMRSPGDDFDLACGFVLGERAVASAGDIASVRFGDPAEFNVVDVATADGAVVPDDARHRSGTVSSACGVCGANSLDDVGFGISPVVAGLPRLSLATLTSLPQRLRAAQPAFAATGGLHAAGAFTAAGEAVVVREDVGRHNAVDKVVGHLARTGRLPAHDLVLCVSGRVAFEIVQKCAVAGFGMLVAVSAPTSLAVALAQRCGVTLAAFTRGEAANVYTHPERIVEG